MISAFLTGLLYLAQAQQPVSPLGGDWPMLVGGEAHGARNIRALANLGLGNFVWIPAPGYSMGNTPWDETHDVFADVAACRETGLHFMVSQRRGLGDAVRPGGFRHGGHGSGEMRPLDRLARIRDAGGPLFVGVHAEEMDIDLIQDTVRPAFMTRVPGLRDYTDPRGGRLAFEGELRRLAKRYHSLGIPFLPNLCVTHQHEGYRAGADMVLGELLEHLPASELQLAYLRGAARQFGRPLGVWVSPWYWGQVPTEDKDMWPAPQAQVGGGHSREMFRRALYLSWASGARLVTLQETEPLLKGDGQGGIERAAWGDELKQFADYALLNNTPVEPLPALAVLIDIDNGWEPAHLCQNWNPHESVWGKLPIGRRTDGMLREYFNVLLPGFMRTPESVENRTDEYPGYFAATPGGPFDVVKSDISADALAAYPAVVALGHVEMRPEALETLKTYVAGGGRLLLNVYSMLLKDAYVQDEAFLGVRLGHVIHGAGCIVPRAGDPFMPDTQTQEEAYAAVHVEVGSARVLADDGEGHPVILRNDYGGGSVYLVTAEYMMSGWGSQTVPLRFLSEMVRNLASASDLRLEGASDLSWLMARQGADHLLLAANHAGEPHTARLVVPRSLASPRIDVGAADAVSGNQLTVPGRDVVLLRFESAGDPSPPKAAR